MKKPKIIQIPFKVHNYIDIRGDSLSYSLMDPFLHHSPFSIHVEKVADDSLATFAKTVIQNAPSTQSPHSGTESTPIYNISWLCQSSTRGKTSFFVCYVVFFDINEGTDHIAKLYLPRNTFRTGESIVISVDLKKRSIPCFQVRLSLLY